ncbi:MAG: hypothetical protein U5K69_27035 [Balneolaceae bacterium]|nr:hypothetical protein [Balneolaceae bacterium]
MPLTDDTDWLLHAKNDQVEQAEPEDGNAKKEESEPVRSRKR